MENNVRMLAYCGLYCEQCSFKRAHDENDAKHLQSLPYPAAIKPLSEYACDGCKGENCICTICKIKPCIVEKRRAAGGADGLDETKKRFTAKAFNSCADCDSFPCEHIAAFENDGIPHHKRAVDNLRSIKEKGTERWFEEFKPSLQCAECGERASWYYKCTKHGD